MMRVTGEDLLPVVLIVPNLSQHVTQHVDSEAIWKVMRNQKSSQWKERDEVYVALQSHLQAASTPGKIMVTCLYSNYCSLICGYRCVFCSGLHVPSAPKLENFA